MMSLGLVLLIQPCLVSHHRPPIEKMKDWMMYRIQTKHISSILQLAVTLLRGYIQL